MSHFQWFLGVVDGVYRRYFVVDMPKFIYDGKIELHRDGSMSLNYDNEDVKARLKQHARALSKHSAN